MSEETTNDRTLLDQIPSSNRRTFLTTTSGVLAGSALVGSATAATSFDMDYTVSGVPCWTEGDDGCASSTEIGSGPDKWGTFDEDGECTNWDGCTPIAASMIIAYHEGISDDYSSERDAIIDRLHNKMDTNNEGGTDPIYMEGIEEYMTTNNVWDLEIVQPMNDGIEDYTEGSNDYSASQATNVGDAEYVLEQIQNKDRPFLLNLYKGGRAKDYTSDKDQYGNHSVCVVGCKWDGGTQVDELLIHDTWNHEPHVLEWGNWEAYSVIEIEAESDSGGGGGGGWV